MEFFAVPAHNVRFFMGHPVLSFNGFFAFFAETGGNPSVNTNARVHLLKPELLIRIWPDPIFWVGSGFCVQNKVGFVSVSGYGLYLEGRIRNRLFLEGLIRFWIWIRSLS